jgi:ferric-dicitrate binding protein FerR (iron transport regulator)
MNEQIWKYFRNELSLQERVALLRTLETDSQLKKEFIDCQHVITLAGLARQPQDMIAGQLSHNAFVQERKRHFMQKKWLAALKYAATVLVLIGGSWSFFTYIHNAEDALMNTLYVPAGQRACLSLNDGTKVWLNARSTLTYPSRFEKTKRHVSLTGEAFFEVVKSESRPFIVSTGHLQMQVLGTQFNVYCYPDADYECTSLLEGSLKVYPTGKETTPVILKPNEEIYYSKGKLYVRTFKNQNHFLWKDGIYNFENESLATILKKLELYYDTQIEVKDTTILQLEYTAKFRQQDGIDEILRQIQKTHRFRIKKDTEKNIITLL